MHQQQPHRSQGAGHRRTRRQHRVQDRQGRLPGPGLLGVRGAEERGPQRHHDPLLLRRVRRGEGRPQLRHRELLGHQRQGFR